MASRIIFIAGKNLAIPVTVASFLIMGNILKLSGSFYKNNLFVTPVSVEAAFSFKIYYIFRFLN